jgi:mono/diheme cytochrome c family protein
MLYRKPWLLLPLVAIIPQLVGCGGDAYPESLRYPSRNDPIFNPQDLQPVGKDAVSLTKPDPPGMLPVMNLTQANQPGNPLNNMKALDPRTIGAAERATLQASLEKIFGTPARPTVAAPKKADGNPEDGWSKVAKALAQAQTTLKLDDQTLAAGSKLYRLHCLHCHGLAGDGRGPTAFWVNPHPRDYRMGAYKFTSTALEGIIHPQHADLVRTIRYGIEGTAMPAFNLLPEDDLKALASYVIHLSLRGQVELEVMTLVLNQRLEGDIESNVKIEAITSAERWVNAQGKLMPVSPYPYKDGDAKQLADSVLRGKKAWDELKCNACHADYGRTALFNYDSWGTLTRPANLTNGMFRGGRRPIDLYWRVYGGIRPAGMPANTNRPPEEIWDIINFLQVLPYRSMRDHYGIVID